MYRFFILVFFLAATACALLAQLPAPNQSGVSMGHVHLLVADPEAQKKIWVGVLGAEATHSGTLELLRLPGIYIVVGKAQTAPAEGTDGSTVNHIGFAVKDLATVKGKLDAFHVESAPVNGNTKQIMAKFPEKVTVELTEDTALPTAVAFHHIHLATPDPEKQRAWYVKTFGARPGTRGSFLAAFIPGGEVDTRKTQDPQAPTKGRSLDHIGFEVRNLESFCKQLSADGVQFESAYRDAPAIGLKIAFLVDPEGTRIELTEGLAGK
jgi:catechol 2,3-dioxygenase-like lactoylglutathione lyase family enzyme